MYHVRVRIIAESVVSSKTKVSKCNGFELLIDTE